MFKAASKPISTRTLVIKLGAFAVGIVVVVSLMVHLSGVYRLPQRARQAGGGGRPAPPADAAATSAPGPVADVEARINLPKPLPAYLSDPTTLDAITDFTAEAERRPLMYLLYRAWQLRTSGLRKKLLPEDVTWNMLREQPARFRGRVVRVKGRLRSPPVPEDFTPSQERLFPTLYHVLVDDEAFRNYELICIEEPLGYATTDRVDVPALFMKMGARATSSVQGAPAVLVTFGLGAPLYLEDPEVLYEGEDRDYAIAERPVWYAVHQLGKLSDQQLRQQCKPLDDDAYRRIMLDAVNGEKSQRGKVFSVEGMLLTWKVRRQPNPLGLEALYYAWVLNQDRVFVCVFDEPPTGLLPEEDIVRAYGMFVQVHDYPSKSWKTQASAPVLVAKRLVRIVPPSTNWLFTPVAVALLLCGGALAAGILIARRRDRSASEARLRQRLKNRPDGLNEIARSVEEHAKRTKHLPPDPRR